MYTININININIDIIIIISSSSSSSSTEVARLDTLQRGVQWMGGAVDWGSII